MEYIQKRTKTNTRYLIPIFIGIACFFIICGPNCLDPSNIAWLVDGDSAQHYLGWAFYKNSPWTFPIGLNPDWGLENASSICFADALPLFAIFFKIFKNFLSEPFQYYGIWFLFCFITQAILAWRIFSGYKISFFLQIVGTILITYSPILTLRLGGHQSLTGHFLILWGLSLYVLSTEHFRWKEWIILFVCSLLIHPYFTVMLAPIYLADVWKFVFFFRKLSLYNLLRTALLTSAVCLFTMWQIGLIGVGAEPGGDSGFGSYRFNLYGLFNSMGLSLFLPALPIGVDDYEGYAYLGAGVLVLLFCIIIFYRFFKGNFFEIDKNPLFPLAISLAFLLCYSISTNIGLGKYNFEIFNASNIRALQTFRASGRFIWPVWYSIIFFIIIYINSIKFEKKVYKNLFSIFIVTVIFIQIIDLYPLVRNSHNILMQTKSDKWSIEIDRNIWEKLSSEYNIIRVFYNPGISYKDWKKVSLIASSYKMKTNSFYLARSNQKIIERQNELDTDIISKNDFNKNTIYIFKNGQDFLQALLKNSKIDPLYKINGLYVFLPGFEDKNNLLSSKRVNINTDISNSIPQAKIGEKLSTADNGLGVPYLGTGWSTPENWGTWSLGDTAFINIFPAQIPKKILFVVSPFVTQKVASQEVEINVNGTYIKNAIIKTEDTIQVDIPNVSLIHNIKIISVSFHFKNAVKPSAVLCNNSDDREIAIGIKSITLLE